MSDPSAFGFGQFVPGFDFLQNLSKTASQAQPTAATGLPGMANWVAPTLNIEDIDKRIQELKSVLFWLEQNTTALKATIQAMEVQKMTLTTLQSMNVNMADLAKAFTAKSPVAETAASPTAADGVMQPKASLFTPKPTPEPVMEPTLGTASEPPATDAGIEVSSHKPTPSSSSDEAKPAVDPMQWWGALTQQFQGLAAAALKDVAGEAMKAGMAAQSDPKAKVTAARKNMRTQTIPSKSNSASAPSRVRSTPRSAKASAATQSSATKSSTSTRPSSNASTRKVTKTTAASPRKAAQK